MKALTLLIGMVLLSSWCNAQQGEIVYMEYGPDTLLNYDQNQILFDVDFDDEDDLLIFNFLGGPGDHVTGLHFSAYPWETGLMHIYLGDLGHEPGLDTIQFGDTLANIVNWKTSYGYEYTWDQIDPNVNGFRGYLGTRKKTGDNYYYGWIEFKMFWDTSFNIYVPAPKIVLYRTAFCTIPNYPLRAGQTSLSEGVDENASVAFATIHPNPTTGLVTIVGKDLNQADVVNMLGQCVTTVQEKGETLQIDISKLPAGIYFVRITDDEGRKCTHKVVKE